MSAATSVSAPLPPTNTENNRTQKLRKILLLIMGTCPSFIGLRSHIFRLILLYKICLFIQWGAVEIHYNSSSNPHQFLTLITFYLLCIQLFHAHLILCDQLCFVSLHVIFADTCTNFPFLFAFCRPFFCFPSVFWSFSIRNTQHTKRDCYCRHCKCHPTLQPTVRWEPKQSCILACT